VVVAIILLIVLAILPRGSSRRFPRLLAAPRVVHTAFEAFHHDERKGVMKGHGKPGRQVGPAS
jgi:hypothetical protein